MIMRVGPDHYQETLEMEHTKVIDITGRLMIGWVTVTPRVIPIMKPYVLGYNLV